MAFPHQISRLTHFFPFLLLPILFVGCSEKIVVKNQDSIILRNHGSRPIHRLIIKPCKKPYEAFEEMAHDIKPGETTLILLYPGCFDADALDEKGENMATQYKLRIPPQLRWDVY